MTVKEIVEELEFENKKCVDSTQKENSFQEIVKNIAQVLEEKNESYGNAYDLSAEYLKLHFPNGIPVESYKDVAFLCRNFDKTMRIAHRHYDDSYEDIAGYSILQIKKLKEEKNEN